MIIKDQFPSNPTDGMLFESVPGVMYIYSAGQNAWIRLEGESARPATPLASGLMSAEDLKKLNSVILPPPQTTISIEGQAAQLKSGTIDIYSLDRSIEITTSPVGVTGTIKTPLQWAIHENTAGIDIKLNLNKFIQDIEALGKLKKIQVAGPDGPQGAIGNNGADYVMTGPEGKQGLPGNNAIFPGNAASETVQFDVDDAQSFRAVVDIETETVDSTENYLVLTRANIGNPGVCPTQVKPQAVASPWLLIIDESEAVTTRKVETSDGQLTCRICTSSLYYLNIDAIVATIKDRFATKLAELKRAKEDAVREWLRTMATVFNEQKYALCCALNNCQSRKRNTETRRYIEQQRIQAVQADHALIVDSSNENKVISRSKDNCAIPDDTGGDGTDNRVVYRTECDNPLVTVRLDARIHTGQPQEGVQRRWLTANIPAGDYVLEVVDCCADLSKAPKPEQKPYNPKPVKPRFNVNNKNTWRNPPLIIGTVNGNITIYDPYVVYTEELVSLIRQQALDWTTCIGVGAPTVDQPLNPDPANFKRKQCQTLFYKHVAEYEKQVQDDYAKSLGWVDTSTASQVSKENSKFTGVVSIQYIGPEPTADGSETTVKKITSIPDLGTFNDISKARTNYIGSSTAFSHAGGEVALWIEDPDGLPTNNDGEVVVGIRSRKCVEVITTPEPTAGEELTYLYVYRDAMSLDTLIGKVKLYSTDATQHENYGYDGVGANIVAGPTQESGISKAFFVRASDGLAFYLVNHINGVPFTSEVKATISVENNNTPITYEADEMGEVVYAPTLSAEVFEADWHQNDNADGIFINNLDDHIGDNWTVELNASDFGAITKLTANGSDGSEFILAQGVDGGPISTQTDSQQSLLCRALRRSCNVPEGFGGRYSLGITNRKPKVNFRLCKTLPEWTLESFIQNEYTYAPYGYPCGCTQCDVRYEKIAGQLDCDLLPRVTGEKVDLVYLIDVSQSMRRYDDAVPDFLDKFAEFMATSNGFGKQPSIIRVALVTFGGHAGRQGNPAPNNGHKQGDPYLAQSFIEYDTATHKTLITDKIRNDPFKFGPAEPSIWAAQWTAGGVAWDPEAIKCIIMITNEDTTWQNKSTTRKGVTQDTATKALLDSDAILNVITRVKKNKRAVDDVNDPVVRGTTRIWKHLHGMAEATGGSANFEIEETLNAPASENISGWIYDQPFKNLRAGIDVSVGGVASSFKGTGLKNKYVYGGVPGYFTLTGLVRGPDLGFNGALVQLKSSATGSQIIASSITDEDGVYQFRIPSEFFPTKSNKSITFTIQVLLYSVQANDPWEIDNPDVSTKRKHRIYMSGGGISDIGDEQTVWTSGDSIGNDSIAVTDGTVATIRAATDYGKQRTIPNPSLISDGYYPCAFQRISKFEVTRVNKKKKIKAVLQFADNPTNPDFSNLSVRFTHDTTPCATDIGAIEAVATQTQSVTIGAPFGRSDSAFETIDFIFDENTLAIRRLTAAVSNCRETFLQKFKRTKFAEIYLSGRCTDVDKETYYNNGPSTVLKHVAAVPMTAETLVGRVVSITATIYALPNLSIRPLIFNSLGQGLLLKSHNMAQQSMWETHSWRLDEIDKVVLATSPQAEPPNGDLIFTLTDVKSIAFEFVNPPAGRIAFFGEVKVSVERETPLGREIVMVEISNFEPFKSALNDPGEIPLVKWIGTPTENDFSNYLECFWTIAQSSDALNEKVCLQLREYCPECQVSEINVPTETGYSTVQEIVCSDKTNVPLNKYIFSPQAPGDSCLMHYKQVIWYNRGWRIGACCGARIDIDGTKWLIVKRSVGIDMTCGGGESESTRCISQFTERGEGHPAIAWPTIDGEEFTGIPLSGYARFVRDTTFSEQIKQKLITGMVEEFRGGMTAANAADTIPFILFPTLLD